MHKLLEYIDMGHNMLGAEEVKRPDSNDAAA
jgi:hypothetical protein